jgi:hypothetical protein
MSVGLQIEGAGEFLKLRTNAVKLENGIRAAIRKVAREGRAEVIAQLSKPGTGRFYPAAKGTRRNAKRFFTKGRNVPAYTASAPGQPPARASGNLLASIRTKFPKGENGFGAKVFETRGLAFYRHFLEFGAGPAKKGVKGRGGVRAPRPVFTPLQKKYQPKLEAAVVAAIDDFVRV